MQPAEELLAEYAIETANLRLQVKALQYQIQELTEEKENENVQSREQESPTTRKQD